MGLKVPTEKGFRHFFGVKTPKKKGRYMGRILGSNS